MKKIALITLSIMIMASFSACSKGKDTDSQEVSSEESTKKNDQEEPEVTTNNNDQEESEVTTTIGVSEEENITESLEMIYEYDSTINAYLNSYNKSNPDVPITSEQAQPYSHHGSEHKDQIHYYQDEFEIVITSRIGNKIDVFIGASLKAQKTDDDFKEMYIKYVKAFNLGLNDDEIGQNWDTLINDLTQNVQFDGYEADVQSFDDRIEYMTITSR